MRSVSSVSALTTTPTGQVLRIFISRLLSYISEWPSLIRPLLIDEDSELFETLTEAYRQDMHSANTAPRAVEDDDIAVVSLPDAAWARRVSGVYGNDLANQSPDRAHAVLTDIDGGYLVSVRAPLNNRSGADEVCRQFDTGGGRAAAAGINKLPHDELGRFIDALRAQWT